MSTAPAAAPQTHACLSSLLSAVIPEMSGMDACPCLSSRPTDAAGRREMGRLPAVLISSAWTVVPAERLGLCHKLHGPGGMGCGKRAGNVTEARPCGEGG